MRRNKRTKARSHEELTSLTERILSQMGQEGAVIRKRLKLFYRQRALRNQFNPQSGREDPV